MSVALDAMLVKTPGVCGGRLRIDGTRITVGRIAVLYRQGLTAEDISQKYPHLEISRIYAALAYYHANRGDVDAMLADDDALFEELARANRSKTEVP